MGRYRFIERLCQFSNFIEYYWTNITNLRLINISEHRVFTTEQEEQVRCLPSYTEQYCIHLKMLAVSMRRARRGLFALLSCHYMIRDCRIVTNRSLQVFAAKYREEGRLWSSTAWQVMPRQLQPEQQDMHNVGPGPFKNATRLST